MPDVKQTSGTKMSESTRFTLLVVLKRFRQDKTDSSFTDEDVFFIVLSMNQKKTVPQPVLDVVEEVGGAAHASD